MEDAPCIAGAVVRQHLDLLAEEVGNGIVRTALGALSHRDRTALENVSPVGWIPVTALEALYSEIAQRAQRGVAELHATVGYRTTTVRLRTIWKVLLRFTSDEALIARAPVIFSKTYDCGKLSVSITAPGEADIVLSEMRKPPAFVLRGIPIGIQSVLEVAGRRNVRIRTERRPDGAVYRTTWIDRAASRRFGQAAVRP